MPRTTNNSKAKDGCGLGACWTEREIKAVLKAAKDAEKKEAKRAEEATRMAEIEEANAKKEKETEDLAKELIAGAIEEAILKVAEEKANEAEKNEEAEAIAVDMGVNALAYEEDEADKEVAGITTIAITTIALHANAVHVDALHACALPNDLRTDESLTATPVVTPHPNEVDSTTDEEPLVQGIIDIVEGPTANHPVETTPVPQLVLYGISMVLGKRPRLEIHDASNDTTDLSSKKVKRCIWTSDNVPASVKGKVFTPNQALIHLRDALDASKKSMGSNGINMKVNLCSNELGPAQTLKRIIDRKELHKFINQ